MSISMDDRELRFGRLACRRTGNSTHRWGLVSEGPGKEGRPAASCIVRGEEEGVMVGQHPPSANVALEEPTTLPARAYLVATMCRDRRRGA